ncbi:MAG: TIM barrel protein [Planctomycetota bacterium]
MKRRTFLSMSSGWGAGLWAGGLAAGALVSRRVQAQEGQPTVAAPAQPKHDFKLKYAPHFGMFRRLAGQDLVDQLKFAADQGFTAWEDNGMMRRPVQEQERLAKAMTDLGIEMGVFVAEANFNKPTFVSGDKQARGQALKAIDLAIETAKRVNAKWMTVVPGAYEKNTEWDYQTANCVDLLKRCCDKLEPHGLVMVLEPLNWWANHPGVFLHKIPQAYLICRAVGSPSCKILFDIYHQQITEGNLIPNINKAWSEVAYFQCGDNPGRKEPGTGEVNYRRVFQHLHSKGFEGIMGMEHGNSRKGPEGDQAVIDAYVAADNF